MKARIIKGGGYGMVPWDVILDARISARAVRWFAYLMAADRDGDGLVNLEQKEIEAVCGGYSTIRSCTNELRKAGHIEANYDRTAHLTTYKMLWGVARLEHKEQRQRGSAAPEAGKEQRQPVGAGSASGVADAHIADNYQTKDKEPAPTGADLVPSKPKGKANGAPTEAQAFVERFLAWFGRQYQRPHTRPEVRDFVQVTKMLRGIRESLVGTPFAGTDPAEVIAKSIREALSNRAAVFPLNKGEDLTLRVLTQHWHRFFENVMKAAQEAGDLPAAHDTDLHQEAM
jgi:hypothetical protein